MDLIYMNTNKEELGVIQGYDFDLAFGEDENDFELKIAAEDHCCEAGYFIFIDGTEYGGIVDGIQIDTENGDVTYSGRTWHGILGSKIIMPQQAVDNFPGGVTVKHADENGSLTNRYLIISGNAHACMNCVLIRAGLGTLFKVSSDAAPRDIVEYQFDRYTDVYSGFRKMLKSVGLKLCTTFKDGVVELSAVEQYDFSQDEEFTPDGLAFILNRKYKTVNHLICLGSGELAERMVVHLYADENGTISLSQTFTGMDEYAATFDYPNVESEDELIKSGTDRLKSLWEQNNLSISFDPTEDVYDLGDIVGAYDNITKASVVAEILKKIVSVKNGIITISYKVGEK